MEPDFKRAIILVDHGSRIQEANRLLEGVVERLQSRTPGYHVQVAHMELAEPSIEQAFALCAEKGVKEITVFPYFLVPGLHTTEDIPELCKKASQFYPSIRYCITEPFGLHDQIIEIIRQRVGI